MSAFTIEGFKFYPTQAQALELGSEEKNFYYATDINKKDRIVKAYGEPLSIDEFLERYQKSEETLSFYELIVKGTARLEYYDIDNETEQKSQEIFKEFTEIYDNFLKYRNIKTQPEWVVSDSSKKGKVSIHLINKNRGFKDEIVMKEWYNEFKEFCDSHYPNNKNIFDTSVCSANRCMRMIKSTKFGQNRPLESAKWYHKKDLPIEDYFIQNLCEDYNIIDEIKNKKAKANEVFMTEISVDDVKMNETNGNEIELLIKLITEKIEMGEHKLCDEEIKKKMKYEDFRNFIFSVINACMTNKIDFKAIIEQNKLYKLYRHHEKFNKENIMKTLYDNCETKKEQTSNKYSIKSLHYWARENPKYNELFKKKEIVLPEIDMNDDFSFGEWCRKYSSKIITYGSDEYRNLLSDFCRVVAVIENGKLLFFIKSDNLNLSLCENIKMLSKIWIRIMKMTKDGEKITECPLKFEDGSGGYFNILNEVPKYDTIKCVPFSGEKKREIYYNTFYGFKGKYVENYDETKITDILNHIKNVICNKNEECYNYMLNWLASIIQKPTEKTGICILCQSNQGAGKGIFLNFLINYVIGNQNSFSTSGLEKIVGRFNSHLDGKIFCEIDELQNGDSSVQSFHSSFDTMKNLITEESMSYEQKGQPARNGINYLNFWINTNNKFSIKVEDKDRRYFPLEVSNDKIGDFKYFDNLKKAMNKENGNIFFSYLMDFHITRNLLQIPKTKLKDELIENSKSIPELFYDEIKNGDAELNNDEYEDKIYPVSHFYDVFKAWCHQTGNKEVSLQRLTKILHTKYPDSFKRKYIDGKQIRCIEIK